MGDAWYCGKETLFLQSIPKTYYLRILIKNIINMKEPKKLLLFILAVGMSIAAAAQEALNMPLIQTKYTADPAPYVHGDTIYLYIET